MFYTEQQIERVLTAIGLDIQSEAGDDWLVFCPYHNNYRTPAGEVSKDRGTFYCFSCSTTVTLERLVMKVSGRSYYEALRLIKSKETGSDIVNDVADTLAKKPDFIQFDELLVARLHQSALSSERARNYFEYRKIDRSIRKFSLGYSEKQDMVTVPVHAPDGMLLGFVGRGVDVKSFKNSPGLPKSKTLFNVHRVKSSPYVFVVESSFDAIRLDQMGLAAVATLGAGLSRTQGQLLNQYFTTVYFIPDADQAGQDMLGKMNQYLGNKVVSISLPDGAKDVGDLTDEQINRLHSHIDNPLLGVL